MWKKFLEVESLKIFDLLRRGLKIFLFWTIIFFLLKLSFIFFLREFLAEVTAQEIFTTLIFGLRMSFQTAGIFTLIILLADLFGKKFAQD